METLKRFKALLLSPYLKREFAYGKLTSDRGREVIPLKISGNLTETFFFEDEIKNIPFQGDLIFVGSTADSERAVAIMSRYYTPIVRYSKFYGGRSEYSGRTAEEGGYSFDIPKDVKCVKALLEKDSFLEAILERNPERARTSLEGLNKGLSNPVIATSFLERALR